MMNSDSALSNPQQTPVENPTPFHEAGLAQDQQCTPVPTIEAYRQYMCAILPAIIAKKTAAAVRDDPEGEDGDNEYSICGVDTRKENVKLAMLYALEALAEEYYLAKFPNMLLDSQVWLSEKKREATTSLERAVEFIEQGKGRFERQLFYGDKLIERQYCEDSDAEAFYKPWREMLMEGADSKKFILQIVDVRTHEVILLHKLDRSGKLSARIRAEAQQKTAAR